MGTVQHHHCHIGVEEVGFIFIQTAASSQKWKEILILNPSISSIL